MRSVPSWAVTGVITERFLNELAAEGIGDGVEVPGFRSTFQLPMMGPVEISVEMTIVEVTFRMLAADGGRLRATVRAIGHLTFHGENPMPPFPGPARVAGEVLVDPEIELRRDGSFIARLDLPGSELVAMHFEGIDGVEADATATAQMGEMLLATVGGELFGGLAERLGHVGLELDAVDAEPFAEVGVEVGPADVEVTDGHLLIGLRAVAGLAGSARHVDVGDHAIGVGLAAGSLVRVVRRAAREQLGRELPFDLELTTERDHIGGRVRSTRLVNSEAIPDLRTGLRYTLRSELVDGAVEISLREAWLELPLVPSFINDLNRRVGGLVSLAPLGIRLPASAEVPVRPGSDRTMSMHLRDLDVADDGVHAVVAAEIL